MKNLRIKLSTSVLALMFLFATNATAASITSLRIVPMDQAKMLWLSMTAEGQGTIQLKILNHKKEVLFSEKIKSVKSLEKKFNLKHLKDGIYIFQVEDEFKVRMQPITMKDGEIEVMTSLKKIVLKPGVRVNNNKNYFDINWMMNEVSTYELTVEGENTNFSFKDKVKGDYKVHKRYNTAKLRKGTYYLTIKNDRYVYYKTIKIE